MEPSNTVDGTRKYKKFTEEDSIADLLVYWREAVKSTCRSIDVLDEIPWREYAEHVVRRGTIPELRICSAIHYVASDEHPTIRYNRRPELFEGLIHEDRIAQLATIIHDASSEDIAFIIPLAIRDKKDSDHFYEVIKCAPNYSVCHIVSSLTWYNHEISPRILRDVFPEIFQVEDTVALHNIIQLAIGRHNTLILAEFAEMLDGARFANTRRTKGGATLLHCAAATGDRATILIMTAWLPPSAKKETVFDDPLTPLEYYYTLDGIRYAEPDPEVVAALSTYTKAAIFS